MCKEARMTSFETMTLPQEPDVLAPDGSQVRILLRLQGGSMAHFRLEPGQTSIAVAHRSVEELWYVVSGHGEMWRRQAAHEEITQLPPGSCVSIPVGTAFQFRCSGVEPFEAVAVTMPPWPGNDEAYAVEGAWQPRVEAS
jgi:mannose-6-phosphate isomerase-like protein (cupin superfamily)